MCARFTVGNNIMLGTTHISPPVDVTMLYFHGIPCVFPALSELSDASAAGAPTDVVPPKFTQLLKDLSGIEGTQVRFECRVIGHPTPDVKWFREGQEICSSPDFQVCSTDL